jgi:hypothetical protein
MSDSSATNHMSPFEQDGRPGWDFADYVLPILTRLSLSIHSLSDAINSTERRPCICGDALVGPSSTEAGLKMMYAWHLC